MNKRTGFVLAVFAVAALFAAAPYAQEREQPAPAKQQAVAPIQGELVTVDADAKTFVVKTADGDEVQFKYSDKTEVTGSKEGAAGLATQKGGKVRVTYTEDAQTKAKMASRIEITPQQ